MIQILHKDELGLGLQVQEDKKLGMKVDNSGNVQFELTETGVKGNVALPEAFDPATLTQQIQELQQAKTAAEQKANELEQELGAEKVKVQTLEGKVTALENREDVHLSDAVLEENELVLTIEGVQKPVRVDLAKFLQVVPTTANIFTDILALPDAKARLINLLKGEEVKNFADESKGFLLATA